MRRRSSADLQQDVVSKSRAFRFFDHVPGIRDTNDPEYAGILLVYVCIVVAALFVIGTRPNGYTHVLQTAGGFLVLLGLYITGVALRTGRLEQCTSRVMGAIAQLGTTNEAVQIGTIRMLEAMLYEAPNVTSEDRVKVQRYKTAIIDALESMGSSSDTSAAQLARRVAASAKHDAESDAHQA
jgi:hypothetical protein